MVVLMIADIGCITLAAFLAYWLLENYIALPDGYYYVMVGITCGIYILLGTMRHLFSNMPHYTDIHDVDHQYSDFVDCLFALRSRFNRNF